MSVANATRRTKWHPLLPPPPTPKILNLPRRTRRKPSKMATIKPPTSTRIHSDGYYCSGRLDTLFDQETAFSRTVPIVLFNSSAKREKVEEEDGGGGRGGFVEEKWRFEAEILRAECNILRMEREFALKKLERNRVRMERTLRSAVQTLVSGRKKIHEGKNVNAILEEEIEDLAEKLEELQKGSKIKRFEFRNCSNFDKKAYVLQRRREKLGGLSDDKSMKEIGELSESSMSIRSSHEEDNERFVYRSRNTFNDVEVLTRKMEGLSIGMLDRMEEECGSMLSPTANSSVASSASTSKQMKFPESCSFSTRQPYQELVSREEKKCSGRCKAIVCRIVEQVRAETEQWSQMQEMLGQVRKEMEELQASRDFWEDQALESDSEIQMLRAAVQEWKQKALTFETEAKELQNEVSALKAELESWKTCQRELKTTKEVPPISLGQQVEKEMQIFVFHLGENHETNDKENKQEKDSEKSRIEQKKEVTPTKDLLPISLGKQLEMEKHVTFCCLKENEYKPRKLDNLNYGKQRASAHTCDGGLGALKRLPFKEIGNSSQLMRQKSKAIFPLRSPKPSKAEECF